MRTPESYLRAFNPSTNGGVNEIGPRRSALAVSPLLTFHRPLAHPFHTRIGRHLLGAMLLPEVGPIRRLAGEGLCIYR